MTNPRTEIAAIVDARAAAIRAGDAGTIAAQLASDIVSFDVIMPLRNRGAGAVRDRLQRWFDAYEGHIGCDVRDLVVRVDGSIAFSHALMRFSGTLKSGGRGLHVGPLDDGLGASRWALARRPRAHVRSDGPGDWQDAHRPRALNHARLAEGARRRPTCKRSAWATSAWYASPRTISCTRTPARRTTTRARTTTSTTGTASGRIRAPRQQPEQGYAEITLCLYLPDGTVVFMFGRPHIPDNARFDAGDMRFVVTALVLERRRAGRRDRRKAGRGEGNYPV